MSELTVEKLIISDASIPVPYSVVLKVGLDNIEKYLDRADAMRLINEIIRNFNVEKSNKNLKLIEEPMMINVQCRWLTKEPFLDKLLSVVIKDINEGPTTVSSVVLPSVRDYLTAFKEKLTKHKQKEKEEYEKRKAIFFRMAKSRTGHIETLVDNLFNRVIVTREMRGMIFKVWFDNRQTKPIEDEVNAALEVFLDRLDDIKKKTEDSSSISVSDRVSRLEKMSNEIRRAIEEAKEKQEKTPYPNIPENQPHYPC